MFKKLATLLSAALILAGSMAGAAYGQAQWNYTFDSNIATTTYPGHVDVTELQNASCISAVAGRLTAAACSPSANIGAGHVLANPTGVSAPPTDTSATSWFDQAYCNTVGYLVVRLTSAWTCSQGIPASIVWFGSVGNNSTDNCTAITNAMASGANDIYVPSGAFRTSCGITLGTGQTIAGGNNTSSILSITSATADFVTMSGAGSAIRHLLLTSSATRTNGWDILASGSSVDIGDVNLSGYFKGIEILGSSSASPNILSRIHEVHMYSPATGSGSVGIQFQNYSSPLLSNVAVTGSGATQPDIGILIQDGDTLLAENVHAVSHGLGLKIESTSGHFAGAINFSNCLFDSPSASDATDLVAVNGETITSVNFSNCSFGNSFGTTKDGFSAVSSGTGVIQGVSCANCLFIHNTGHGAYFVGSGTTNVSLSGGFSAGNTSDGITLQGISNCSIRGMTIGAAGGQSVNGGQGINFVGGNATARCVVSGNAITGNAGGQVGNFSTSATNVIRDNPGYNPVGATGATSMGASPFTYTASASPETIYVKQTATNTATCTAGGQQVATLANASTYYTVDLGPNESMICTYATTTPTYTKYVH